MTKVYPLPLTKEQKNKILEQAETEDEFDYMLFLTLATTGRRIGELYGVQDKKEIGTKVLDEKRRYYKDGMPREEDKTRKIFKKLNTWRFGVRVEDINFEEGTMKVWTLKKRKFTDQDIIPLVPRTLRVISQYIKKNRLTEKDFIFRKKSRSLPMIRIKLKQYAKKSGVLTNLEKENIKYSLSVHSFRHYFITELQKLGVSNDKIVKLTGHKDIKTLSIYSHTLGIDFKKDVMPMLNEIWKEDKMTKKKDKKSKKGKGTKKKKNTKNQYRGLFPELEKDEVNRIIEEVENLIK